MYQIKKTDKAFSCVHENAPEEHQFFSIFQGFKIILSLLEKQKLNAEETLSLIQKLLSIPLPIILSKDIPERITIFKKKKDVEMTDLQTTLEMIDDFSDKLRLKIFASDYPEPILRVCPGCGKHGRILYKKCITLDYDSKEELRECIDELKDQNIINLAQELDLLKQVKESSLPEKIHSPQEN